MRLASPLVFLAISNVASLAATISFSSDTDGLKGIQFQSAESPVVHFSDSDSANPGLGIGDFGPQSQGKALAVYGTMDDDYSHLIMSFEVPVTELSFQFGNDDPHPAFGDGATAGVDQALLTVFSGGVEVGRISLLLNANDLMDQTISYNGFAIDAATFVFADPSGTPLMLAEVVDEFQFTTVPEPNSVFFGALMLSLFTPPRRLNRTKSRPTAV